MELTAVLTRAAGGGFIALAPETGTITHGETVEEAVANLKETTALYLAEFLLAPVGHTVITTICISVMPTLPLPSVPKFPGHSIDRSSSDRRIQN